MTKRRRGRESAGRAATAALPAGSSERDLPLAILAGLGMVLTELLLWRAGTASGLPYCGAGSSCDVVQSSAWSRFLGLPLAAWGLGSYALLAALALGLVGGARRRRWTALVASAGFGISVYLALVSATLLGAHCPYCLFSLALFTLAFARTLIRRPADAGLRMHITGLFCAAAVAVAMHANALGWLSGDADDPYLRALAGHLAASGAAFYGASWCPHCQEQKKVFGAAADVLPYVECSPNGPRAPRATACEMADIRHYPTWVIGGRRIERLLPPETLARLTGFAPADPR